MQMQSQTQSQTQCNGENVYYTLQNKRFEYLLKYIYI